MKKLLVILFSIILSLSVIGQDSLKDNAPFFQAQKEEFDLWLATNGLDRLFSINQLEVKDTHLELELGSNFATDDSLRVAWDKVQEKVQRQHRQRISERMLQSFAFLCDVAPKQVKMVIRGKKPTTSINIYYDTALRLEENFSRVQYAGKIEIPLRDIKFKKTRRKINKGARQATVTELRQEISNCLTDYYRKKKGGWLYKVIIDTSRSYYNHFVYRIYCLKNEVIQENYFEIIQIKVAVKEQNGEVQIDYDLQAKYAPYLRCPKQKDKYYKSIEVHYPNAIESYAEHVHNLIESYLRR